MARRLCYLLPASPDGGSPMTCNVNCTEEDVNKLPKLPAFPKCISCCDDCATRPPTPTSTPTLNPTPISSRPTTPSSGWVSANPPTQTQILTTTLYTGQTSTTTPLWPLSTLLLLVPISAVIVWLVFKRREYTLRNGTDKSSTGPDKSISVPMPNPVFENISYAADDPFIHNPGFTTGDETRRKVAGEDVTSPEVDQNEKRSKGKGVSKRSRKRRDSKSGRREKEDQGSTEKKEKYKNYP